MSVTIARVLPGVGLMFDGHVGPDHPALDEMLTVAADWLVTERGVPRREAAWLTAWRPGLVAADAWVGDHPRHGIHFVQAHHEGARPVTVVRVPVPVDVVAEQHEHAEALAAAGFAPPVAHHPSRSPAEEA